jgi:anaerobic selenocysteine-containing dehydrogenase
MEADATRAVFIFGMGITQHLGCKNKVRWIINLASGAAGGVRCELGTGPG